MKRSTIRALLWSVFLVLLGSCDGSSMGCSGCDSMAPIPGDFPLNKRVENAAQAHVGYRAIEFLQSNVDPLIAQFFPDGLSFEIPATTQEVSGIGTINICPDGGCAVNLHVSNVNIAPSPPSSLRVVIQVQVALNDLPIEMDPGLLCWCIGGTCNCSVDFNTSSSGRPYNSFALAIDFDIDTATGYTAIKLAEAGLADEIESGDLSVTNSNFCGLAVCNIANLGFVKDLLVGALVENLSSAIEEPFNDAVCRKCGTTGCPSGSTCDGGGEDDLCKRPDGSCVPMLLGIEGRLDLTSLLAGFSPTTEATADLLFAAGGYADMVADPKAINMGFYGGLEGAPPSACARQMPVACELDTDCRAGFTCRELTEHPSWIFPCRRCFTGCPEGSTPRDKKLCQADPADPRKEFDPSQPCMKDDDPETCVPVKYCVSGAGALEATPPPGAEIVPVAPALKRDEVTHCVYCDDDPDCTAPYTCDMLGVCTKEDDPTQCQTKTDPTMVTIGISETFLRRALYGAISSGAACIEVPPGTIAQLSAGTLTAVMPALRNVIWENAPLALVVRPSLGNFAVEKPQLGSVTTPDVSIADSPLLGIELSDVSIDFYAWIEDTYSRFLTITFDMTMNVDLQVRDGKLTPVIRNPVVQDLRPYNNDLLPMDETSLRTTIQGVLQLAMGFIPAMDPIEIPAFSGFKLTIPDGGINHVRDGGEDFLALYANLAFDAGEGGGAPAPALETSVRVVESYNPPVDLARGTAAMFADPAGRPSFTVQTSAPAAPAGRTVEYRVRLNGGPWGDWTRSGTQTVSLEQFVFQGRHLLEAQARLAGLPDSADPTPARAELLVDGIPPAIDAARGEDGTLAVSVRDMVSPPEAIDVRWARRLDDGTETPWTLLAAGASIPAGDPRTVSVTVEASDEAGNVATETFAIRGRPPKPPEDSSGCGTCAVTGAGGAGSRAPLAGLVLAVAGIALLVAGRRRRPAAKGSRGAGGGSLPFLGALLFLSAAGTTMQGGCSCSSKDDGPCAGRQGPECCLTNDDCGADTYCCTVTNQCITPPPEMSNGKFGEGCDPGFFCDESPDFVVGQTAAEGCSFDWSCCEEADKLQPGRLGTYLGMDVTAGGGAPTIWVSGYSAGVTADFRYGDLVAGQWAAASSSVGWEILDGVPADGEITNSTSGWRGGISEGGDDVGLYTALRLDAAGSPMISYFDRSKGALKFIQRAGTAWSSPLVVDDGTKGHVPAATGVAGLFGDMVRLPSGEPAVLYRSTTVEQKDHPGVTGYKVVHLASHLKYAARAGGSWAVQVIATQAETPCWLGACPTGYLCRADDKLCWPDKYKEHAECQKADGSTSCATGQACFAELDNAGAGTGKYECADLVASYDLPEGIGLWTKAALNPSGEVEAVAYDRTKGDLIWTKQTAGAFSVPVILDGDDASPDATKHGDRGWYPSLAISPSGARHVAYVDGLAEQLVYLQVDPAGAIVLKEVVDEGLDAADEEKDLVGDNTAIAVDAAGRVRVAYMNSSDGVVMMAVRDVDGDWTKTPVSDAAGGFMGYYMRQVIVEERSYIAFFYFNFESPPTGQGVAVIACAVDGTAGVSCQ